MEYEFTKPQLDLSSAAFSAGEGSSPQRDNGMGVDSEQPGEFSPEDLWECYENHREIVTRSILSQREAESDRLVVLGTGECLDIDLKALSESFAHVKLVDIVSSTNGIERQGVSGKNVDFVGGVDLSGVFEELNQYRREPSRRLLDEIIHKADDFVIDLNEEFDVVASTCLLSQIINHGFECVGMEEHRFIELITALRIRHLETMLGLLKPGGRGVLVTDFVASTSLEELKTAKVGELSKLLANAIQAKNYFHGLNPKRVHGVFAEERIAKQVTSASLSNPWRWIATPDLVYACFAMLFEKKADA